MLFDLTKTLTLTLCRHHLRGVFQTLCDNNLAMDLTVHTIFDDLDLISRSQVCQNDTLQIVFRFLSTVV